MSPIIGYHPYVARKNFDPRIVLFLALATWNAFASPEAWAVGAQLLWEGAEGFSSYELQVAEDEKFTKAARRFVLPGPSGDVEVGEFPKQARIRGVHPERKAQSAEWARLTIREWGAPALPQEIRIAPEESGRKLVEWKQPESAKLGSGLERKLTYRVRVLSKAGEVLHDAMIPGTRFLLPALPGGFFELKVETIGDAKLGTLHSEDSKAETATAKLFSPEVEFDPKAPRKARKDGAKEPAPAPAKRAFRELTEAYVEGFGLDSKLVFASSEPLNQLRADTRLRFASAKGWLLAIDLPVTLAEGEAAVDRTPRLGGSPFPVVTLARRLLGDSLRNAGLGLVFEPTIDTTDQNMSFQSRVAGIANGRLSFEDSLAIDWRLAAGSTIGSVVNAGFTRTKHYHFLFQGISLAPSFAVPVPKLAGKLRAGLELSWLREGEARKSVERFDLGSLDSVTLSEEANYVGTRLFGQYRLNEYVYLQGGPELWFGAESGPVASGSFRFAAGAALVF